MNTLQQIDVAILRIQLEVGYRQLSMESPAFQQLTCWYMLLVSTLHAEGMKVSAAEAENPHTTWM